MHRGIQTLLIFLGYLALSRSQFYQSVYGSDPQLYGYQNYDFYPGYSSGYETGFLSPSSYAGYGYSSPHQTRSVDDPVSDAAIKSAMAPLNNIISSIPAQPLPMSPIIDLIESQQRSATPEKHSQQKKSNCTTGCSAAKSASNEPKQGQMNQQTLSQNTQQVTQQSTQQTTGQTSALQGTPMCQCPCTQGYMTPYTYPYYTSQSYAPSQYPKSGSSYYAVAHRTRQPYRTQYRPYTYVRPNYYDPNYHRALYPSLRN